nr:TonB-dependent receptor [Parvularcula maris]
MVVRGEKLAHAPVLLLDGEDVQALRPRSLKAIVEALPQTSISVNSRGEAVASIRGRSERETSVTLNGVPLNDPWDGRVDFAPLPAALISSAASYPRGHAAIGSASSVELTLSQPSEALLVEAEGGTRGYRAGELVLGRRNGALALSRLSRNSFPLSADADLPFYQDEGERRTNSDLERNALLGLGSVAGKEWSASGFVLASFARYGVPPEGHINPDISQVRYWRVPEDDRIVAGMGGSRLLAGARLDGQAWHHSRQRSIEAFTDETYAELAETSENRSRSTGIRSSGSRRFGAASVSVGGELREDAVRLVSDGRETFERRTQAVWADAGLGGARWSGDASVRWEGFTTTRSGDRERAPDQKVVSLRTSLNYQAGANWTLSAGAAKLGRLPSQRELYGEALGRFVINPDLRAERRYMVEAGVVRTGRQLRVSLTPFAEWSDRTIGQRAVRGSPSQRMRINEGGIRTLGVGGLLSWSPGAAWAADLTGTFLDLRPQEAGEFVEERPEVLLRGQLSYRPEHSVGGLVRIQHRGRAWSRDDAGDAVPLPPATTVDAEVSYRLGEGPGSGAEIYLRADNIFDALVLPQIGLPAPGRVIRGGVRLSLS